MPPHQPGRIVGHVVHPRSAALNQKQKRNPTVHPHPPVPAQNIIEISSDEDEEPRPQPKRSPATRVDPPSTNKPDHSARLVQEIENLKKREGELEQVITRQKKEIEAMKLKSKSLPNAEKVNAELECDVCTEKMWTPYRLTECGHVFCKRCLVGWFDGPHANFLNTQKYTPLPPDIRAVLRQPLDFFQQDFSQQWNRAYKHISRLARPQYTCPSCRKAVTRRPIEDFKVKALVSWFGEVHGVEPPKSGIPPGKGSTEFDGYYLL